MSSEKPADKPAGNWREMSGSPLHAFRDSPPPGASVEIEFGAESLRSPLRPVSEDHFLIVRLGRSQETLITSLPARTVPPPFSEYGYGMAVADGVGGTGAGEVASRMAITTLMHLVTYFGKWNVRINDDTARDVIDRADRFFRGVDSTLLHKSDRESPGLQSTLTVAYSAGRDLFVAHIGHSRAYLLREGLLTRLTRDHTLAAERRPSGPLVDINVTARDLHHVLTETLGGANPSGPRIDIDHGRLVDGDRLLLCTNGLTDIVSEDRIAAVMKADLVPGEQCRQLVQLAADGGGADDVTALVARYHITDPEMRPPE